MHKPTNDASDRTREDKSGGLISSLSSASLNAGARPHNSVDGVVFTLLAAVVVAAIFAASRPSRSSTHETPAHEDTTHGFQKVKVRHVIDGDTVVVSKHWRETRVRLYAIDCPEDGQPWGNIAKAGLIKLIGGRVIQIETHGLDPHGRTLATIYVQRRHESEWTNVNERMVMLGHAWVWRNYVNLPQHRQHQLDRLEHWARSRRVGLWMTDDPVPPWRWRKHQI